MFVWRFFAVGFLLRITLGEASLVMNHKNPLRLTWWRWLGPWSVQLLRVTSSVLPRIWCASLTY